MELIPFVVLFPEQAVIETRTVTTRGHAQVPDDSYALVEAYCPDPTCNCRRVMINILPESNPQHGFLASIGFGFDRDNEMAGPFLDPLNPQSRYAEALLSIVEQVLDDPAYVARLESHYHQVKEAMRSSRSSARARRPRGVVETGPHLKPAAAPDVPVYQLKVTLKGSKPPIWRRIQVSGDTSLRELHGVLQAIMGWDGDHLYEFVVGRLHFSSAEGDWGVDVYDDQKTTLAGIAPVARMKFKYEYDFGDGWMHEILVEKILSPEPGAQYPVCVTGKRAGPPDDCGGIWGYAMRLEAAADPECPDHQEQLDWLGEGFDPEAFDLEAINRKLKRITKRGR